MGGLCRPPRHQGSMAQKSQSQPGQSEGHQQDRTQRKCDPDFHGAVPSLHQGSTWPLTSRHAIWQVSQSSSWMKLSQALPLTYLLSVKVWGVKPQHWGGMLRYARLCRTKKTRRGENATASLPIAPGEEREGWWGNPPHNRIPPAQTPLAPYTKSWGDCAQDTQLQTAQI